MVLRTNERRVNSELGRVNTVHDGHLLGAFELEGRALEEGDRVVLAGGDYAEGPGGPEVARVHLLALAGDLAHRSAGVHDEHVAEPLPPFADHHHPLAVRRPRDVLDASSDGLVLLFQDVFLLRRVPYPDLPALICKCNVKSDRGKPETDLGRSYHRVNKPGKTTLRMYRVTHGFHYYVQLSLTHSAITISISFAYCLIQSIHHFWDISLNKNIVAAVTYHIYFNHFLEKVMFL